FLETGKIHYLNDAITLLNKSLELCPPGHSEWSSSLGKLAFLHMNKYDACREVTDLEKAIKLGRAALKLCPPGSTTSFMGHIHHGEILHDLTDYLWARFQKKAEMKDLEEAIELYWFALALHPLGHPKCFSALHSLALCLSKRHDSQGIVADLEEAIAFVCEALALHPLGPADCVKSLCNLVYGAS
ncbi:hypothetical protein EDC04DRAFT_2517900, partial [Pisolithus marmoratus]